LLSPTLDQCFDSGFISFDDKGKIMISPCIDDCDIHSLGLISEMTLSKIEAEHLRYLEYHRKNIFRN